MAQKSAGGGSPFGHFAMYELLRDSHTFHDIVRAVRHLEVGCSLEDKQLGNICFLCVSLNQSEMRSVLFYSFRSHLAHERMRMGDLESAIQFYKCAATAGDCVAQLELAKTCASLMTPFAKQRSYIIVQVCFKRKP